MAKNDWIVASLNNPNFTPADFSNIAEMNLDNTQMLSELEYLKSDFIKNHELFKDDSGNFSEKKFKQFYQHTLQTFGEFQELEFPKGPQLDMFDTDRTKNSKVKDILFNLGRHVNPDRQAIGIEGVRVWSDPTQTKSEIAQSQKIWDSAKGEFKEYSSNDKALSNGLFNWLEQVFSDPLVLALWESDGEHIDPITGLLQKHKKGQYKLNDKGTYYYETLNNRNPIGKEVLSVFDTLTVDGLGINKYDFFDSDDIKKSISGVIAKNVVSLLPVFTPAGTIYASAMIAKEFSKALPMLYGIATILNSDSETPKWINNLAAIGTKFTGSTSLYAKEHLFSFENFGNLISDVALLWGLQKTIAAAVNKLRKSQNYIDEAMVNAKNLYKVKSRELGESEELWTVCQNKFLPEALKMAVQASLLGRDISMAYMAIISNSDLYNDMKTRGLTNSEAASIALGSTLGMFGLNKYTKLGEIFFDDATDDAVKLARTAIKNEMSEAMTMFNAIKNSNISTSNKILQFIKTASNKTSNVLSKFSDDVKHHSLGFLGKAVGEGLEEVGEELISDTAKSIYELAGLFGVDTTLKDVGAWENMLERYTMSLLGGMIGGGIFYGKEVLIDGKSYKKDIKNLEIATLIRNGHANELRAEVEKLKKVGKLGSTTLSASKYEKNENGDRIWLTTTNKDDSQNNAIANAIINKINAIETVINNNRINLSDELLFENMVLSEQRYKQYKQYEQISPLTNYYLDFNNIIDKLIEAELNLESASNTIEGTVDGTLRTDTKLTAEQETSRQEKLSSLRQHVEELRNQKDDFLSGNTSLEYTRKLNFLMDPILHSLFLSIDLNQFFKEKYGNRQFEDLTLEEMIQFQSAWSDKVKNTLKSELDSSWKRYKEIEDLIVPELKTLEENTLEYKKFNKETEKLFSEDFNMEKLFASYLNFDSKLDGEDEDLYKARNTKLIIDGVEETDEVFKLRQFNRHKQINNYNEQKDKEWADKINELLKKVDYKVDPFTFRYLRRTLPHRQKDIVEYKINTSTLTPNIKQIVKRLNPTLDNVDEIKQLLRKVISEQSKSEIKSIFTKIRLLELVNDEGQVVDIYDYIVESLDGEATLKDIVEDGYELDIKNAELNAELSKLLPILGENVTLYEVIQQGEMLLESSPTVASYIDSRFASIENQLEVLISDITTNHIYSLANSIKNSIKNPIGELIKSLAAKRGDYISNIDEILNIILNDFENIEDVNLLILNDAQMNDLSKVRDYMKLIKSFMYAAASNPNKNNPIGHNLVINTFAKNNKDKLIKEWDLLPEIDSDYYIIYDLVMNQYISEIDYWINFSNSNNVNKIRKFVATDKAFNTSLYEIIKSSDLNIKINEEEFNLLEEFVEDETSVEISLFNAEKALYKNFQAILQKTKLSVSDLLNLSKLIEKLVPSLDNISKLKVAKLTDTLKKKDLMDFDLILYFAQVLTLNPSLFLAELKSKVEKNKQIAPITALEYSTKLAKAISNLQYRDIIQYAYKKSNCDLPYLRNTLIIPGIAGSGKTSVVLSSVNDSTEEVIIAGPTTRQANNLQKSLGRTQSYTFNQLLKLILGESQFNEIMREFDKVDNTNSIETFDCKYFTVVPINNVPVIKLKPGSLKFILLEKSPKKIFLDEATHLSSLEMQILDAFAESIGAVNYLAGDPNQRGAFSPKAFTRNLQEDQVFASRAPKLSISLRDDNLQKYINQENVKALLDAVDNDVLNLSKAELQQSWPKRVNTFSKFNFKVYNQDELNGDLITSDLNIDLINKLKDTKVLQDGTSVLKTVGFIGDESSPYLQKLREAGLNPSVRSMNQMLGEEFDYVIIDQKWQMPQGIWILEFLRDLYTTMTRARTAAIFIDNGLSSIIGKNVQSEYKSKAPSILEGVNELREKKLSILNKLKFDIEEIKTQNESKTVIRNPDEDFTDPDKKNIDLDVQQIINKIPEEDEVAIKEINPNQFAKDGELLVETFTDITILGAENLGKLKREVLYNGEPHTVTMPVWLVQRPEQGPLRNLQALYTTEEKTEEEFISYNDKIAAQKELFNLKSCIIYQHGYNELSIRIKQLISEPDWNQGRLELEIRTPEVTDTTHLNAKYKEAGFEYRNKKYIANIVFTVKLKDGSEAKFDISGLPSIDSYRANLPIIKANLNSRISQTNDDEEKQKLQKKLDNSDATFNHYKSLLENWIEQFEAGTFKPIPLDDSTITYNKTTWFQDLQKSKREAGIQLGGKVNPITGERLRDSLQLRHPELVFSPIYTYAKDTTDLDSEDFTLKGTLKGKAVILVSSDTTIHPDDLLDVYMQQKSNPEANTARVRMLVLDNYGMTFSQLIDTEFIDKFKQTKEEHKPLRLNFTGIRMFTALWNWRASLMLFNTKLDQWMDEHGYDDRKVEILTEVDLLLYDAARSTTSEKNNLETQAKKLLQDNNLTELDLQALRDFNSKELIDVPTFRLGYPKNEHGFYIQGNVDVSGSSVYNKNAVNLVAITINKAQQFQFLIDKILSGIVYSDGFGDSSLGLRLLHEDGTGWQPHEFIDFEDAKHRRTLSGLLSKQNKAIILLSQGKNIKYEGSSRWSLIPALISNIVRTVTYLQYHPDEITNGVQYATLSVSTEGKEKLIFQTQIDEIFSGKYLQTKNQDSDPLDASLLDLMDLVFHGTIDDIHKELTKGTSLLQAEDSYFKYGFFASPDVSRKKTSNGDLFTITDAKGQVLFYKIATSPELFTVDTDVRTSGLGLRINDIFKNVQKEEKKTEEKNKTREETGEDPIEKFKREYPDLSKIITDANDNLLNFEYSLDFEQKAVNWRNKKNIENIKKAIGRKANNILDYKYEVTSMGGHVTTTTFKEYIIKNVNIESNSIEIAFRDELLIIKSNNIEYKVNKDLTITKLGDSITTSKYDQKLSNGKTVKLNLLDILSKEDVRLELINDYDVPENGLQILYEGLQKLFNSDSSEEDISSSLEKLGSENEMTDEDVAYNNLIAYIQVAASINEDSIFKELINILTNC